MMCGTYIEWKMVGRKKPVKRISRAYSPHHVIVYGFQKNEGMELCDGNVYPNVELDYDGCGGGCCGGDYHIEVKFVCDKCGTTHQEFPRDEHWYNQFVKELMDGRNIEEIRSELLQKQKDHQEHVRKLAEKYERESKARIASAKAARLKKEKK